ncbi:Peptidase S41 family protein [Klebsormidium nitens]|uniref:C-terminal processing peptidase n=1 Tax=Klebsormidium nitens TaxID=105231 RepID=A0A0U9I689_KLENI|nr:Peptidase S41 family protein [Klebsormidium nitens]|eukprot:GAQ77612.1 Peptidase S41 family protein [Klebsormidium nitens]
MVVCAGSWAVLPTPAASALTEENLVFLEAWRTVDRAYIDKTFNGQNWFKYRENALKNAPMNDRDETYAAIRKMLATLDDPFTRFLEPEKFRSLKSGAQGAVTGVGLEVGFNSSTPPMLVVVTPVTGGPADKAGVQPGDAILAIDDTTTEGMGLYDAAQRLQGPIDSEVVVTIRRNGSGKSETVQIKRQKITLNPVSSKLCTPGNGADKLGYIRLSTFNSNSTAAVREAIEKLKEEGAKAYVLDIRNNSGGLFPSGVEVAKMWLDRGVIVFIEDSKGIRDIYEQDDPGSAISVREPLAVLVNKGTASASEILAGALKDNKRAVILGEPTFGKGKIQSVFALSDGSGLAVTIARYVTPAKIDIDKVGITPDRPLPGPLPANGDDFCKLIADPSAEGYIDVKDLFAKSR